MQMLSGRTSRHETMFGSESLRDVNEDSYLVLVCIFKFYL